MPRSRRLVVGLSLGAALLLAATAEAQYFGRNKVHYERLDFRVLQTEHFDIYYYEEEAQATRHAARMAERWYARFSQLLNHTFRQRQPLVLYASHPHFAQTNLTTGSPGESIGGLTERLKSRIAMPFAAGLGETDHVLGHEIAHAFQIDIAKRARQNAFTLPGWFIEGMAEYLSLGPVNAHTAMWLRDAALHDALPTLEQLNNPRYFPYRYGHALWAYLATRFGDEMVGAILRSRTRGVLARLEQVTGLDRATLTRDWHASVPAESAYGATDLRVPGRAIVRASDGRTRLYIAPALSPDGGRLMFLSERDRLSLDLFVADASNGAIQGKILSTAADPHFDSLQYIHSAGAWDPEGRRFAFTAIGSGEPVLTILDTDGRGAREVITLPALGEIYHPSWSPDGARVVFSALQGGLSDLFVYTFATGKLQRLTTDEYADLQPAWSPDGRTIAFASDRFTTSLDDLRFGPLRIALLDVEGGTITAAHRDLGSAAKQINPQWSPASTSVYFISDRSGASNVYRVELGTGELRQVTDVRGGVSGITSTSPALAVAARTGALAFSVYQEGRYEIRTIDAAEAVMGRVIEPATGYTVASSPAAATNGVMSQLLADPRTGLPQADTFSSARYDDRLRLESVSQPYVGAATGNTFGGALRASFGFSFGDMLRDRQLHTLFRVGTDIDDLAAQIAYLNRRRQWNWGVTGGMMPSRFFGARRAIEREGVLVTREMTHLRYTHQWTGLTARYGFNRVQRFEFGAGVRRTGFEWQTVTRVTDVRENKVLSRDREEAPAGAPIHLAEAQAAFVHDTAVFGATSPVLGQRLRIEVEPVFGGLTYADVRFDLRRYFMPVRPLTIAARVEHVGRYGPGAVDPRLTPLVLGLQTLVRGYDLRGFAADECGRAATECSIIDELTGSRLALLNLELRVPLLGLLSGDFDYGKLPIEAIAFVDAGFLWTRQPGASIVESDRFRSVGAGARVNVGGIVFEITGVRPFDRVRNGWTVSFLLRPGF
jgi:Tol biopolymer transport system component